MTYRSLDKLLGVGGNSFHGEGCGLAADVGDRGLAEARALHPFGLVKNKGWLEERSWGHLFQFFWLLRGSGSSLRTDRNQEASRGLYKSYQQPLCASSPHMLSHSITPTVTYTCPGVCLRIIKKMSHLRLSWLNQCFVAMWMIICLLGTVQKWWKLMGICPPYKKLYIKTWKEKKTRDIFLIWTNVPFEAVIALICLLVPTS